MSSPLPLCFDALDRHARSTPRSRHFGLELMLAASVLKRREWSHASAFLVNGN